MRRRLIVGNWKMNMLRQEATELARRLSGLIRSSGVDVVIAPPYTSLEAVYGVVRGTDIHFGAQDVFWETSGAFTGEISPYMLIDAGCSWVITGHSERRGILGETDDMVRKKVRASLSSGLIPIVCVGETLEERERGKTMRVIESQIENGLKDLSLDNPDKIAIAYEPVWAIGTGKNATPEEAAEVHGFIRGILKGTFGGLADGIRILYGGSVTPENIKGLLSPPDIDGALVGGASLKAESFAKIVQLAGE
ncbi:MAG: triose-phosphate isomerase [Ignavibacteriales bacterium]